MRFLPGRMLRYSPCLVRIPEAELGSAGQTERPPYARNVFQDLSRISANIAGSIFPPLITAT